MLSDQRKGKCGQRRKEEKDDHHPGVWSSQELVWLYGYKLMNVCMRVITSDEQILLTLMERCVCVCGYDNENRERERKRVCRDKNNGTIVEGQHINLCNIHTHQSVSVSNKKNRNEETTGQLVWLWKSILKRERERDDGDDEFKSVQFDKREKVPTSSLN